MYYDLNGIHIRKEDDDLNTNYFYDSYNNLTALSYEENTVYFYYDSQGSPIAMSFDDTMYYYIKNLQGDIVSIVNQDGKTVVTYTYDAFGKVTSKTDTTVYDIADLNPFRYRGYVYDSETGLYYLKSRYYDPETGRFINADIYCDTQSNIFGTNMFTYCNNNPVNQVDPEGTDAYWVQFGNAVNGFGHTSLLIQDSVNNWWYFYWGPKHAYLRPCGEDDFTEIAEFESYITGFDPRPEHNYYVYATNVLFDFEDANYSLGSDYYLKCHDLNVTEFYRLKGDFFYSYWYAKDLLEWLYIYSNANQLCETIYENEQPYTMYHVCSRLYLPYVGDPIYCYKDIVSTNEEKVKGYDGTTKNCVQVSMKILLQGSFANSDLKYEKRIKDIYSKPLGCWPNNAMYNIFY